MSHADKRSPSTDALETLGMIHFKPEARDAIHLAVEPVIAATNLKVGQKIGTFEGEDVDPTFWEKYAIVRGKPLDEVEQNSFFTCSC